MSFGASIIKSHFGVVGSQGAVEENERGLKAVPHAAVFVITRWQGRAPGATVYPESTQKLVAGRAEIE